MSTERVEIVDTHLHAWPTDMNAMLTASEPAILDAKVYEDTLAQMDALGISQAVISGPNNVTLEYCQRAPDRFIGLWMPNWTPSDPEEQTAQFAQAVETQGFRGLGEIAMQYLGAPVNHERYFPLYRICEERHLAVFLHTGLDGRDFMGGRAPSFRVSLGNPLLLEDIAAAFPALKMVICHMGYPFTEQAIYMLFAHSNVYMDVATVNWVLGRAGFHRLLRQVVDTVGADKILFGTDQMAWPEQIPVAVSAIQEASFLSQEDKYKILSDNARRLLGTAAIHIASKFVVSCAKPPDNALHQPPDRFFFCRFSLVQPFALSWVSLRNPAAGELPAGNWEKRRTVLCQKQFRPIIGRFILGRKERTMGARAQSC